MHFAKAKGILSSSGGMNLYRGCTHGCIYCDARSACYQMEHVFEDIEVKENALVLLENALKQKRKKCMIATGAMTDPYLPAEETLQYTKRALELIEKYGFGAVVHTKSNLILRDIPLLQKIHQKTKCVVQMTLTTMDDALCRKIEPNVCTTRQRFEVLMRLKKAGIPTVVWLCPILPFLNDTPENIAGLVELCAEAGVFGIVCFGMGLTLREGNREYFYAQLDRLFPGLKQRYIDSYGARYEVLSPRNALLMNLFFQKCRQYGLVCENQRIFEFLRAFEEKNTARQLSLFSSFLE